MKTNSDTTRTLYLGLDAHKEKTVIAILEADRDAEPCDYGSVATSQHALERVIRRIAKAQGRELCELHVCYEASGCGFWIARRLQRRRTGDPDPHGGAPILVTRCNNQSGNSTRPL